VTHKLVFERCLFGLSFIFLTGCGFEALSLDASLTQSPEIAYPEIDAELGEKLQKDEKEIARKIAAASEIGIRRKFVRGQTARRDVHSKGHGCVAAKFVVEKNLEKDLAKGVFIPGKAYDAIIRFSNAAEDSDRPDYQGDGRGMAIKLFGVPGKKLLDYEKDAKTQDFIMVSHPVFPIDDLSDYLFMMLVVNSDSFITKLFRPILIPWALGLKGTFNALDTTSKTIDNPLNTRYWSMVPYQLGTEAGRRAIKFSARQCSTHAPKFPDDPSDNFLRVAMKNKLKKGDACMNFFVQPRTSSAMSVENSQEEWLESDAPFYKVASILIPEQEFDTPDQNDRCENLSFNPWHALPEHRPLGAVNRARKVIYPHISQTRHELNTVPVIEPAGISGLAGSR